MRNALLRRPLDEPLDDERGFLLEHLVAYEMQRRIGGALPRGRLHYFRTRHGAEVDFVLEVDGEVWAIEVKAARHVDAGAFRGLSSFAEHARKLKRQIVLFLGPRKQLIGKVEILPLHSFLEGLAR